MNKRDYVIVCNEHSSIIRGALLFWGSRTEDDAKRSFGGYTCRIDKCERYTREELESFRGNLKKEYPFFDEIEPGTFNQQNEVLITVQDLKKKLGYREFHIAGHSRLYRLTRG